MLPDDTISSSAPAAGKREHAVAAPLSNEVALAAAALVERVLSQLAGRIFSPRIKFLDIKQVCEATGLGRSTIYALIQQHKFPKPQRNLGRNMWRESGLIAWADANDPNRER